MLANKSQTLVRSAVWRLIHYDHRLCTRDPNLQPDEAAFSAWRAALTSEALEAPMWARTFLDIADKASRHADAKAAALGAKRFKEWVCDGPAAGLRRQHLFTRTASRVDREQV